MRTKLSTLWIFATLNYLYCDVVTLMDPDLLKKFLAGNVGGMEVTQGFLLGASVLVEIPIAMVLLSRVIADRANRWANIVAGVTMTLVQTLSLFAQTPAPFYVFFSVIEIAATASIVWLAWRWGEARTGYLAGVLSSNHGQAEPPPGQPARRSNELRRQAP
ncbi:MAG TPA: DUF6326 family protein [Candidatus Limnocylindrales bacterium]|nr:DUF6326 family protein [Candidatus Limnocylindrales bacterium]